MTFCFWKKSLTIDLYWSSKNKLPETFEALTAIIDSPPLKQVSHSHIEEFAYAILKLPVLFGVSGNKQTNRQTDRHKAKYYNGLHALHNLSKKSNTLHTHFNIDNISK